MAPKIVGGFLLFLLPVWLHAQGTDSQPALQRIQDRLDALERENQQLLQELQEVRKDLQIARGAPAAAQPGAESPAAAPLNERVAVVEARTAEQAQTKVEASQKFPFSINGMLLFNAFSNSRPASGTGEAYGLLSGPGNSGATVTQSMLGFNFEGPKLPGDGHVNGSLTMDFFGGYAATGQSWLRIREADVSFDWLNRSFSVGQYKPLISPLSPESLAEVGVPPLSGSGNLWLWLPQARYEERVHFGLNSGLKLQAALLQTGEQYTNVAPQYTASLGPVRPAYEGRFALWHKFDDVRRIEIAPGFHVSSTRVAGVSVPSRIASFDWSVTPFSKLQLTGSVYRGRNVAPLGSLGNGFTISPTGVALAVHTSAGWAQVSLPLTTRFTFNVFGGLENDDRGYGAVHEFTYASNFMYHFGPNVVVSLEALQLRDNHLSGPRMVTNHYDLGVAYLF
jgi:hypothetical protein